MKNLVSKYINFVEFEIDSEKGGEGLMRNLAKMVGMMQLGLSTAILEASPRSDWQQQHSEQQLRENQRHEQAI